MILSFLGCIGIIDGVLVKIRRPRKNPEHGKWFNGCKKMYCMNNVVIVDHHGLFIYVNPGYTGLFHNVNCLRALDMYGTWHDYFVTMIETNTSNMCLEIQGTMAQRCSYYVESKARKSKAKISHNLWWMLGTKCMPNIAFT